MKTEPTTAPQIDPGIVEEASHLLARYWAAPEDPELLAKCNVWRAAHPQHELVWQRLQTFGQKLDDIPTTIARHALLESPSTSRRATLKLFTTAAVITGAGYVLHRPHFWQQQFATYRTALGETRQIRLEDGTRVWMNTATSLDVEFTNLRRVILYSGEIFVETGKDPQARPFILVTAQGDVRPIGTQFNLRALPDKIAVGVYDGSVELLTATTKQRLRLDAGQQAQFSSSHISTPDNAGATPAWTTGFLAAERMTLSEFAQELSRYRRGKIQCTSEVAAMQLTGVFSIKDTDRALMNLTKALPIELEYRTRYWVLIKARQGKREK